MRRVIAFVVVIVLAGAGCSLQQKTVSQNTESSLFYDYFDSEYLVSTERVDAVILTEIVFDQPQEVFVYTFKPVGEVENFTVCLRSCDDAVEHDLEFTDRTIAQGYSFSVQIPDDVVRLPLEIRYSDVANFSDGFAIEALPIEREGLVKGVSASVIIDEGLVKGRFDPAMQVGGAPDYQFVTLDSSSVLYVGENVIASDSFQISGSF